MDVDLKFNNLDDFEPDQVVQQVEPLRKLVEARQRLSDLLSKTDGNDKLEKMLNDVLQNAGSQQQLANSLGLSPEGPKRRTAMSNAAERGKAESIVREQTGEVDLLSRFSKRAGWSSTRARPRRPRT